MSKGSGGTGGASTLYQLVDVLANDTEDGVEGAAAGKALVFDGTHWRAGDAGLNESQLYSYLTANKYLTQSAADSRYVTSSRKVIAGTGLSGGGALTSDVTLSLGTSGVVAGTYTKVMVDAYGRVTSGTNLSATDIPNLDWSKITTGKPTTLAGYGITDAYTKTEADGKYVTIATAQTVSGAKTFSTTMKTSSVLPSKDANSALGGTANRWSNVYSIKGVFSQNVTAKLLSASESLQIGDAYLKWDAANNAVYVIKKDGTTPVGFYSTDWLSAKGVSISGVQTGTLADLNDVEITDPVNGQALKYDAASKKWVNGTIDSFNVNQMWAELKKADSSKIIDASHIPTSVLDGRWVKKAGDTMTGTLTSASSSGSIVFKGVENCDITNIYKDNGVIRNDDGGLTSIRNGLRFNWCDTYWYIGNLRGSSTESAGFGVVDHNNKLVLRVTPNDVRAPRFMSTVATGLSPLIVSSNTTVDNLSADLLDGYHAFGTSNALIKYGYTVGGTEPAWCRIATYSIRNVETMTDVCFVLHSAFNDLFGLLVVRTRGTSYVQGELMVAYNINTSNIRIYHDAEKKNIELYCHGGNNYSVIQANLLYSHSRYGEASTNITLYRGDTKAPSWSTYVNPVFAPLQNSSEVAKKLQTPRTLWGQSFDGTANVSGNMTGVGSITMSGDLKIGNGTSPNAILFYGTTGDGPGSYSHTFIAERFWGGTESGELVLFKGNDLSPSDTDATTVGGCGPDRIRHIAAAHLFQTYASPISGSVESICTSSALRNLFSIAPGRVVSYIPLQSIVASGTAPFIVASNTVVGNLNADLLDGLHAERFLLSVGRSDGTFDLNTYSERAIKEIRTSEQTTNNAPFAGYGLLANLWDSNKFAALQIGATSADLFFRGKHDSTNKITSAWHRLLHTENYASIADGRYVKKDGDTMTGDLTMSNAKGFKLGWSARVVKASGVWIHGGADTASSTDANLRFGSWYGIGWYPTTSGQIVAQGENAMWLNVRNGNLDTHGVITSHNGYLAANWDSARRLILGGGSYVWIDSRDSSNNVLCNIVLYDNKVVIGNYAESRRFVSTVGTGTQPYQCNSTTLNTNLNADMLDNWHIMDIPRNYDSTATYSLQFALGSTDNKWKKIFACSESGTGPWRSVTVWGQIWYAYGNHAQSEVRNYHFCAIFYMRSGPSSSDSSVGNVENSARLYLPTFAKGMDNIRLVRVGTNNFELQVRQISSYHNGHIQYQYRACGANVSAWRELQSTSNTSVAVSAGGASTLADSRASSADVWTTARTFYIQDHDSSHTGAGVNVNGGSNVYLKLPSSIQCSDWFRSTGNSGWYHQNYGGGIYMQDSSWVRVFGGKRFYVENGDNTDFSTATAISTSGGIYARKNITSSANIIATGAITAKASSSDIRLKTDIQGYDAMGIIRKFRSVKYHWNAVAKENSEVFNHDNWNYGLIAQDLLSGGYTQWVKDIFNDYYTIDYERLIPVVWKGLQEVDDEVTKLKREVARLNKRVKELEKSLCA